MSRTRPSRRGFTLVELLVVLTIIGILVALLVPAAFIVLRNARNARISMEIAALSQALEAYKTDNGDYPPNFNNADVVTRHVLKRWQRIDRAGQVTANSGDTQVQFLDLIGQLNPAEALVFWLGGQSPTKGGLKANDVFPLAATGEPKTYFAFDQARFTDTDGDGWYEYAAPYSTSAPYAYFDARSYAFYFTTATQYNVGNVEGTARGVVKPAAKIGTPTLQDHFVNPQTFQIIASGQDGMFGGMGTPFPDGPYVNADKDNIANYTEGKTFEDSKP